MKDIANDLWVRADFYNDVIVPLLYKYDGANTPTRIDKVLDIKKEWDSETSSRITVFSCRCNKVMVKLCFDGCRWTVR